MSRGNPRSPLLELAVLFKIEEDESIDVKSEFEQVIKEEEKEEKEEGKDDNEEEEEEEDDDGGDVYKDLLLHPHVVSWVDDVSARTFHGIQVLNVGLSTEAKRHRFTLCPMCVKPFTLDQIHQMSCLPCGHIFGMSCLKKSMEGGSADKCPECDKDFSLESVRLLYVTSLCIPASAYQMATDGRFSFDRTGYNMFKKYELVLRTDALKNRSDALKQRADALGRQTDAMKRRTDCLNRMAVVEKRADVLERQNAAIKQQIELVNQMTDEQEEQQAHAEKRAEVLRRKAVALGQSADEYLQKADAFGQQAEALYQEAKSLRQLAHSYLANRKFFIQSYKEFLGARTIPGTLSRSMDLPSIKRRAFGKG